MIFNNEGCTPLHSNKLEELTYGHLSHDQMAGKIRMLMRDDLQHEAVVCAARDRIKWMEWRINELERQLGEAVHDSSPMSYRVEQGRDGACHIVQGSRKVARINPNVFVSKDAELTFARKMVCALDHLKTTVSMFPDLMGGNNTAEKKDT